MRNYYYFYIGATPTSLRNWETLNELTLPINDTGPRFRAFSNLQKDPCQGSINDNISGDKIDEFLQCLNSLQRSNALVLQRVSNIASRLERLENYFRKREVVRINTGLSI
jgi:hypothetical protein